MFKYFAQALAITNNNIILATPLILFLLLLTLYQGVLGSFGGNSLILLLGFITTVLMWAAFFSGWFYIIRQAVIIHFEDISKEEKIKKSFGFMSLMLKGIGEYFLSFLGLLFLCFILFILLVLAVHYAGMHFIGRINISLADFVQVANSNSPETVSAFANSIPLPEAKKLIQWTMFSLLAISVFVYITMFWACAILKNSKNVIKSLWISNKFLWKNFLSTFIFFILVGILQFIVMMICTQMSVNSVMSYFSLLLYFYFIVYAVVLVFLFYEKQETKGVCRCGSDSIGQDSLCDKSGKED